MPFLIFCVTIRPPRYFKLW